MRRLLLLALILLWLAPCAFARKPRACVPPDQAAQTPNKDVCVAVHVYEVVELPDGTRFLDVCSPDTSDDLCRFTIVSLPVDRDEVGSLLKYRDANVQIRGILQPMHGRWGMELSHARQFYGGPPKFRPNPRLAHGFGGEQQKPAVPDPNLRPHGGRRAFMNSRDLETRPAK